MKKLSERSFDTMGKLLIAILKLIMTFLFVSVVFTIKLCSIIFVIAAGFILGYVGIIYFGLNHFN